QPVSPESFSGESSFSYAPVFKGFARFPHQAGPLLHLPNSPLSPPFYSLSGPGFSDYFGRSLNRVRKASLGISMCCVFSMRAQFVDALFGVWPIFAERPFCEL
ncbi:MAG TPA: hypothetical protein PLD73_17765, partial [Candidatus Hydrogenedentes bacterium]|nr:hypothetical protein [Candidatus Hydrogenedentota bacterium]